MNEAQHITALMEDVYNGDPWLDITLIGTLGKITAATAVKKVSPQWNSIWEIVNHMISWRAHQLKRVQGEVIHSPEDNYFAPVVDQSEKAWQHTLQQFEHSQEQWMVYLQNLNEEHLEQLYPGNGSPYFKHIHGIIQHDAYHLGQIVLLTKNN